jgi:vanadium-dependent haloperoxidase-like protein
VKPLLVACVLLVPRLASADAVTIWNENAARAARAACLAPALDPLHESRIYAMVHIAIHDALNAIDRRFRPYAFDTHVDGPISADAAVAAAAHDVLIATIAQAPSFEGAPGCNGSPQAGVDTAEMDYVAALAAVPAGPAKEAGILVGQSAAATILGQRALDGSSTPFTDSCPNVTEPGVWRCTEGFPFALAPKWGDVTPFVLTDGSQFRPGPPYNLRTRKYAADVDEVQRLGGDGIVTPTERTPEQTEIGQFWIDSSPLMWNRIARDVSASLELGMWENARLFGLLNMAMADGYVASFDAKYHYVFWRPVTAIREADTDGNPNTHADPTWTPLQLTYPIPDYPSAHATEGGAAAEVLRQFFGTDDIAFTACSLTLEAGKTCDDASPTWRTFTSFSQAAQENADSRVFIGIHFRDAVDVGTTHGRKIGKRAVKLLMKPARRP